METNKDMLWVTRFLLLNDTEKRRVIRLLQVKKDTKKLEIITFHLHQRDKEHLLLETEEKKNMA
jgi:hypothetical protein